MLGRKNLIFQDNVSYHSAKINVWYLTDHFLLVIKWPGMSTDLKEKVWEMMVRDVYTDHSQYFIWEELKHPIMDSWEKILSIYNL